MATSREDLEAAVMLRKSLMFGDQHLFKEERSISSVTDPPGMGRPSRQLMNWFMTASKEEVLEKLGPATNKQYAFLFYRK